MERVSALPLEDDSHPQSDEAALIRAAQAEPAAFGELYRRYLPRLYRYLRTRTGSEDDAADLVQQTFLKALDALPGYRDRGLPFAAWLFRIARNVLTDAHRRQSTVAWDLLPEALLPHAEEDPEALVVRREALTRLRALLVDLDADKRELLALRFAGGLSAREIAAIVGKSEAALKKQLSRVIQTLREEYDED